MLLCGWMFYKWPPDTVNQWVGYRTRMSMKNERTWHFAQRHFSRMWLIWGGPLAGVSAAVYIPFWVGGSSADTLTITMTVLMCAQIAALFCSIIPTERALRRNFNRDGSPK